MPRGKRRIHSSPVRTFRDESLVDQLIETLTQQQEEILSRASKKGDHYEYVSPFYGASFSGKFSSQEEFLAHVEYMEEKIKTIKGRVVGRIHQVPRSSTFRGRYA